MYVVSYVDNEKWTQCEAKGKPPVPSSGSTMSSVGNKLYVFGGLNQETGWSNNLHVYDTGGYQCFNLEWIFMFKVFAKTSLQNLRNFSKFLHCQILILPNYSILLLWWLRSLDRQIKFCKFFYI